MAKAYYRVRETFTYTVDLGPLIVRDMAGGEVLTAAPARVETVERKVGEVLSWQSARIAEASGFYRDHGAHLERCDAHGRPFVPPLGTGTV